MRKINITAVVATDLNNLIGCDGILPFKQKEDMKRFRKLTVNTIVVVGRETFETFNKRPLPNRIHYILTSNPNYLDEILEEHKDKCFIFDSVESVMKDLNKKAEYTETNVSVIGGGRVYRDMLPYTNTIYLTRVLTEIKPLEKAIYFVPLDMIKDFNLTETEYFPKDKEGNEINVIFQKLVRK